MEKSTQDILVNYEEIKDHYRSILPTYKSLSTRKNEESGTTIRNEAERDFTRVLYSSSFRRLQGKMQLLGMKNDSFFRNRLTHSLEVAQIARSIARDLDYLPEDIYIVEAGALAHDIGNPPFGHFGEEILNSLSKDFGGYEGNAQALRVLTSLEKKLPQKKGLNLTNRTLMSIVKYNKKFDNGENKKFIYNNDYEYINKIASENDVKLRTLDVQIVDIADEIAYAAHDLEDGLSQGLFNIDQIVHEFTIKYQDSSEIISVFKEIIDGARERAKSASNSLEYSSIFNNFISSRLTYTLISDIGLTEVDKESQTKTGTSNKYEIGFKKYKKLASGLKKITFDCVTNTDGVFYYERAGKQVLESLYDLYDSEPKYLPADYRPSKINDNLEKRRCIVDYIAGMMDTYAISQFEKFYGKSALDGYYDKLNFVKDGCPFNKNAYKF